MKKFFSAVLALGLLLSVATGSYALPSKDGGGITLTVSLENKQIAVGAGVGLGIFAAYRVIANMQAGAGLGQFLVNGVGHFGNGLLAIAPGFLYAGYFGLLVGCVYGMDAVLFNHKIFAKLQSYLD